MNSVQNIGNHKNKSWLYFALGIVVGFVLSLSIYLIDKQFFPNNVYLTKTIERTYLTDKANEVAVAQEKAVKVVPKKRESDQVADTLQTDTLMLFAESYENEFAELDEVDFMMEEYESEPVSEEKIVANKRIKVQYVTSDTLDSAPQISEYFIVEQWSSPIQNRITYSRDNQMLKIKGMDVSKIEIYNINGEYFLLNGTRYYMLNNNSDFEKLIEVTEPPL